LSRTRVDLPRVIGHRGAAQRAPENTLAGFRKAAELGCKAVEFDVRLTLDGKAVVFHDETLERVTDGVGRVDATLFDVLRALDAGTSFDQAYKGERIPSLEAVFALLKGLGLKFDLELKTDARNAQALAESVARTLDRQWPREMPQPLVTSFEHAAISAFARSAPHIPCGYLTQGLAYDWWRQAERLGAAAVVCDHKPLSLDGVRAVKDAGYPLFVYTVNHPHRAEELIGWGVDGVISDAPDRILQIC
jgi:glycerophosphoryl diester phosphodiesterase